MLLTHYRHRLPADYDMERIRHRIATRSASWDAMPGLGFKAVTIREREQGATDNLYASLYLWLDVHAATDMLADARFLAVTDSFGRPSVATWLPFDLRFGPASEARSLRREDALLHEGEDIGERRRAEAETSQALAQDPAVLATLVGLDPAPWRLTRFTLSAEPAEGATLEIRHLASPGLAALRANQA